MAYIVDHARTVWGGMVKLAGRARAILCFTGPPARSRVIIDFHTHIFPPEVVARRDEFCARDPWLAELYGSPRARMATADDLLRAMDADGVDVAVTFPFGWRDPGLVVECNSYVI